ncbi:MAG: hypothetical protein FWF99_00675 [Desulfovibrionaceae bacterium]|nr:hypothetical protein [Desulfovibrionaceae bacterium]
MTNSELKQNEAQNAMLQAELASMARGYAKIALEALADEMQNGKGASRVSAANAILDRGFGKSRQNLELGGNLDLDATLPEEILNILDGLYMRMH